MNSCRSKAGIVGLAILACVLTATANVTNTIPYTNSFEGYAVGTDLMDTDGWVGGEFDTLVVTNVTYTNSTYLPTTHDNVLMFDTSKEITNRFAELQDGKTNVFVDLMIQPGRLDSSSLIANGTNAQVALYVDTNGLVTVWCGLDDNTDGAVETREWITLANAPVGTSDWVHVGIAMDYLSDQDAFNRYFQIKLNGIALTNAHAFVSPGSYGGTPGGTWFLMGDQSKDYMTALGFTGSSMLDDLVVGFEPVTGSVTVVYFTITATVSNSAWGSLSPSGAVQVVQGQNQTFTVTPFAYYNVNRILSNGTSYAYGSTNVVSFVWPNVQGNGTLTAVFAENLETNGVPQWWLAQHNLSPDHAGAISDTDTDHMQAWQEYIAGTDPTNNASLLAIVEQRTIGTTNLVRWLSANGTLPYTIERSTNLLNPAGWTVVSTNMVRMPPTNTWYNFDPVSNTRAYYRVSITN